MIIRVEFIIECKWSKDKPWIVLTDEAAQISPPACVAQTYRSRAAEDIMSHLAQSQEVQRLSLFHTPERPGFSGRQAFTEKSI